MIENATIIAHPATGGVLVLLPRTGMDPSVPTDIEVRDGHILIKQEGKCFVSAEIQTPADADVLMGNPDITVAEQDDNGISVHADVRGPTT
jgi:hypothetical protein